MNRAHASWCVSKELSCTLDFVETTAGNVLAEQRHVAGVVARRIEFEQAIADDVRLGAARTFGIRIDADAGQHARELLHIGLRIAAVDAERVQLHQLARVVLVDVIDRVLRVVEIAQHRRMLQRRQHEVAEAAERVRPDRVLDVVGDKKLDLALLRKHVEVIKPEPDQLFLELGRGIDRTQHFALRSLRGQIEARLVARLARLLLGHLVAEHRDAPLLGDFVGDELRHRRARDAHRVDLRLDRLWQRLVPRRELLFEEAAAAELAEARDGRAVAAKGEAHEPQRVVAAQGVTHVRGASAPDQQTDRGTQQRRDPGSDAGDSKKLVGRKTHVLDGKVQGIPLTITRRSRTR